MSRPLAFLLGFLCASAIYTTLAWLYYRRARGRVKKIEMAIQNYRQATKTVSAACDQHYATKKIFPSKRQGR